jgi:hypothetical protein
MTLAKAYTQAKAKAMMQASVTIITYNYINIFIVKATGWVNIYKTSKDWFFL